VTDPRSVGPAALPRLVGARVARREDPRLLTGQGSYVDDHRPARLLYAAFLRSPRRMLGSWPSTPRPRWRCPV